MKQTLKDYLVAAKYASERVLLIKKELIASLGKEQDDKVIDEVTTEVNDMQFDHSNDPLEEHTDPPEDCL